MNRFLILFSVLFFSLLGCDKSIPTSLYKVGSEIPKEVTDIKITNVKGGAEIEYVIPNDPNLLYIEAIFERGGKEEKVFASPYSNSLSIRGFNDTEVHEIELFSVSKSEQRSIGVKGEFQPLLSPLREVFATLDINSVFSGVNVQFENPDELGFLISIIRDSAGIWQDLGWNYTERRNADFVLRGLESQPYNFGVYISDEYGNISDTLTKQLIPFFEEELNKEKMRIIQLPSDVQTPRVSFSNFINGNRDDFGQFGEDTNFPLPRMFTIDLGDNYKLSRFRLDERGPFPTRTFLYSNPKTYNIWGSTTAVDNLNEWTLLKECESFKPSGLPYGQNSPEDVQASMDGENFDFDLDIPTVRYLRVQILDTWNGGNEVYFAELTFWGAKN